MDSGEIRIKLDKLWVWSFGQLGRLGTSESGLGLGFRGSLGQPFHVIAAAEVPSPAPPFARLLTLAS